MASISDAVRVLTDPSNHSSFGDPRTGSLVINQSRVLDAMSQLGADAADARQLAVEALVRLGGQVETVPRRGSLRAGRMSSSSIEIWSLPLSAVKEKSIQ